MEYKSIDTVPDQTMATQFPVEFLNSLEISGLPPHQLFFKGERSSYNTAIFGST